MQRTHAGIWRAISGAAVLSLLAKLGPMPVVLVGPHLCPLGPQLRLSLAAWQDFVGRTELQRKTFSDLKPTDDQA